MALGTRKIWLKEFAKFGPRPGLGLPEASFELQTFLYCFVRFFCQISIRTSKVVEFGIVEEGCDASDSLFADEMQKGKEKSNHLFSYWSLVPNVTTFQALLFATNASTSISIWSWLVLSTLRYLAVRHPLYHLRLWQMPYHLMAFVIVSK